MKNLYLVDESGSKYNGIGTYISECVSFFSETPNINLNIILFNSDVLEFTIARINNINYYLIPRFSNFLFSPHSVAVNFLLQLYIEDLDNNVFVLNHSPCEHFIISLKKAFSNSKILFVIHDFGWCGRFLGDYESFNYMIKNRQDQEFTLKYESLLKLFDEEKRMYNFVDRVICLSIDSYNILKKTYNLSPNKIVLIPNGLSDNAMCSSELKYKIKRSLSINEQEIIILFSGRLDRGKGIDILIRAMRKLPIKSQYRLIIAGASNVPIWLLSEVGFTATKITFIGHVEKEELKKWYSIADIGIIPSYYEQCSYTGIEMMMHGLPIISSDGFGLRNMFQDNINALTVKIGNRSNTEEFVIHLASAIEELLNSDNKRKLLSESARRVYESKYTIKHMKKKYIALIDTL